MISGWTRDSSAYLTTACVHDWSDEMLVQVQRCPYALSICVECGKTFLRKLDPSVMRTSLRWNEAA